MDSSLKGEGRRLSRRVPTLFPSFSRQVKGACASSDFNGALCPMKDPRQTLARPLLLLSPLHRDSSKGRLTLRPLMESLGKVQQSVRDIRLEGRAVSGLRIRRTAAISYYNLLDGLLRRDDAGALF